MTAPAKRPNCPACAVPITRGDRLCRGCGVRLKWPTREKVAAPPGAADGTATRQRAAPDDIRPAWLWLAGLGLWPVMFEREHGLAAFNPARITNVYGWFLAASEALGAAFGALLFGALIGAVVVSVNKSAARLAPNPDKPPLRPWYLFGMTMVVSAYAFVFLINRG